MDQSWKVARIHGVDFKLHFSLIFLLVYVTLVSALQFPFVASQAGLKLDDLAIGPFPSGLLFALGLFLSVALHEFGHVLVAQAQGVEVRGITLMMLGGVSEMGKVPERPYSEFKLAIVGPMVSFGIWALLALVRKTSSSPELNFFSYWIGSVNLMLAIFNLLPAFPLDGGRVLRSLLAAKFGNFKATQVAVNTGKGMAWLFGIVGFLNFNFILVLIAFFVYSASQSELMMLITRGILKGIQVKDVMKRIDPISGYLTLHEAAFTMYRTRARLIPVQENSKAVGLVSLDVIQQIPRGHWSETQVKDVMDVTPKILDIHDSAGQAMMDVATSPSQALPVQENNQVVGVLQYSDLSEIVKFKSIDESDHSDENKRDENKAA